MMLPGLGLFKSEVNMISEAVRRLEVEVVQLREENRSLRKLVGEYQQMQPASNKIDPITGEDLTNMTEYCCECGEDYPAEDLILGGEIFCFKCRELDKKWSKK